MIASCTRKEVEVCFSSMRVSAEVPSRKVQFVDCSLNAVSYEWDFGDGTSSTDPNPMHSYASYGNYEVTLTVRDKKERSASMSQEVALTPPINLIYNGRYSAIKTCDSAGTDTVFIDLKPIETTPDKFSANNLWFNCFKVVATVFLEGTRFRIPDQFISVGRVAKQIYGTSNADGSEIHLSYTIHQDFPTYAIEDCAFLLTR